MRKFIFHTNDGFPPSEPIEFPNLRATRAEAVRMAGEMLRDLGDAFTGEEWRMDVVDDTGRPALTFRFTATEHPEI